MVTGILGRGTTQYKHPYVKVVLDTLLMMVWKAGNGILKKMAILGIHVSFHQVLAIAPCKG